MGRQRRNPNDEDAFEREETPDAEPEQLPLDPQAAAAAPAVSSGVVQLTPERFWPAVDRYRTEAKDAGATLFYLYRMAPRIIRLGRTKYIDKRVEISHDVIRNEWGSGTYQLRFTDSNRPGKQKEVFRTVVTINDPERDPVINDYREVDLAATDNRPYVLALQRQGILDGEGNVMATEQQSTKNNPETAETVKAIAKILESKSGGNDSGVAQILIAFLPLVERLFDRIATPPPAPAPVQAVQPVVDPLAGIKLLREVREVLGEMGAPEVQKPGLGEMILASLPSAVGGVIDYLRERDRMQPRAAADNPTAALPGVPDVNIQRLIQVGRLAINAFENGRDGASFAESLLFGNPDGQRVLQELRALGTQAIVATLKSSPAWPALEAHLADVQTFIDEVIKYDPNADEETQS